MTKIKDSQSGGLVSEMSSEQLGLLLGQRFEQAFKIQQEILTITTELQRRQTAMDKGADNDGDDKQGT